LILNFTPTISAREDEMGGPVVFLSIRAPKVQNYTIGSSKVAWDTQDRDVASPASSVL